MKNKDTLPFVMAMGTLVLVHKYTKKMISIGQGGDGKRFHIPHLRKPKLKQLSYRDFLVLR